MNKKICEALCSPAAKPLVVRFKRNLNTAACAFGVRRPVAALDLPRLALLSRKVRDSSAIDELWEKTKAAHRGAVQRRTASIPSALKPPQFQDAPLRISPQLRAIRSNLTGFATGLLILCLFTAFILTAEEEQYRLTPPNVFKCGKKTCTIRRDAVLAIKYNEGDALKDSDIVINTSRGMFNISKVFETTRLFLAPDRERDCVYSLLKIKKRRTGDEYFVRVRYQAYGPGIMTTVVFPEKYSGFTYRLFLKSFETRVDTVDVSGQTKPLTYYSLTHSSKEKKKRRGDLKEEVEIKVDNGETVSWYFGERSKSPPSIHGLNDGAGSVEIKWGNCFQRFCAGNLCGESKSNRLSIYYVPTGVPPEKIEAALRDWRDDDWLKSAYDASLVLARQRFGETEKLLGSMLKSCSSHEKPLVEEKLGPGLDAVKLVKTILNENKAAPEAPDQLMKRWTILGEAYHQMQSSEDLVEQAMKAFLLGPPHIALLKDQDYELVFTPEAPDIDGNLDDKCWKRAKKITFLTHLDHKVPKSETEAWMLWDEEKLYLAYRAYDKDIWGYFEERDSRTSREDVLEFFFRTAPDQGPYYNFEINALKTVYDAYNMGYKFAGSHHRWSEWNCEDLDLAVKIKGTLNKHQDRDDCWQLELAIPFESLPSLKGNTPKPGDRWRFHLARYDYSVYLPKQNNGVEASSCACFAPERPKFHEQEDWLILRFAKEKKGQ